LLPTDSQDQTRNVFRFIILTLRTPRVNQPESPWIFASCLIGVELRGARLQVLGLFSRGRGGRECVGGVDRGLESDTGVVRMCPLRYIVFAVSALVALIILVWGWDEEKEVVIEDSINKEKKLERKKSSVVDFFTGKYLYRKWNEYKEMMAKS